ncbi:MAG TPA: DNA-primase RepB domain-containing protein, partial [Nitrososphaera sp.]
MAELPTLERFFDVIYGATEGYVCIATAPIENPRSGFRQTFFEWPDQVDKVTQFILKFYETKNMWFAVNLLAKPERKKEHCLPCRLVWSDLDEADHNKLEIKPPILIESSPERYQAIWLLDESIDPMIAEDYSKRVAYKYGADKSGWDLGQLLRIPGTFNFKYDSCPLVRLERFLPGVAANPTLFESIPRLWDAGIDSSWEDSIPKELPNVQEIIKKYWKELKTTAFPNLYRTEPPPTDDWSRILWKLINICLECGLSEVETYAVADTAECNKYRRDHRPPKYLWRDVLKASNFHKQVNFITRGHTEYLDLKIPDIVLSDTSETFIDLYKNWATEATDAIAQFHELSAFILLSSICATSIKVNTSYGAIVPNLWGLIL